MVWPIGAVQSLGPTVPTAFAGGSMHLMGIRSSRVALAVVV